MMIDLLPKQGQVMYCFRCDHDLFRFKRDVKNGESPSDELLDAIEGQRHPFPGDSATCSHCGSYVYLTATRWPKGDERNESPQDNSTRIR